MEKINDIKKDFIIAKQVIQKMTYFIREKFSPFVDDTHVFRFNLELGDNTENAYSGTEKHNRIKYCLGVYKGELVIYGTYENGTMFCQKISDEINSLDIMDDMYKYVSVTAKLVRSWDCIKKKVDSLIDEYANERNENSELLKNWDWL